MHNIGEIYRILADSVCEDLKFTTDCPSDNPNGRVPILDTEMWIEDLEDRSIVRYGYFEKKMIPDKVIQEQSAMPWEMKRSILIAEGLRRLLRCDINSSWEEKEKHLRKFTWKMYNSGYKENQARYIVKESIKKYDNMVKEDKDGTRPIHRDAS